MEKQKAIEVAFHHLKGDKNMENKTKMTVTFSRYEYDLLIAEEYPDGSVKGEFAIVNTPLGFQLKAYHDSWKIFSICNDLFELLSNQSMSGVTMERLAEMIDDIGYELRVV